MAINPAKIKKATRNQGKSALALPYSQTFIPKSPTKDIDMEILKTATDWAKARQVGFEAALANARMVLS